MRISYLITGALLHVLVMSGPPPDAFGKIRAGEWDWASVTGWTIIENNKFELKIINTTVHEGIVTSPIGLLRPGSKFELRIQHALARRIVSDLAHAEISYNSPQLCPALPLPSCHIVSPV